MSLQRATPFRALPEEGKVPQAADPRAVAAPYSATACSNAHSSCTSTAAPATTTMGQLAAGRGGQASVAAGVRSGLGADDAASPSPTPSAPRDRADAHLTASAAAALAEHPA